MFRIKDKNSDIYSCIVQVVTQLIFFKTVPKVLILTNYTASRVCRLIDKDGERKLFISPAISNNSFIETTYLICSLFFKEIGDTIEGWNEYVENSKLKDDYANASQTTPSPSPSINTSTRGSCSDASQLSKKSYGHTPTTTETNVKKLDDSGLDSGIDATFDTPTRDDLYNTLSNWTPLGYGLCGVVDLAVIKVISLILKDLTVLL